MDTDEIIGAVKRHWPIAVGIVGGVLLIAWYRRRQSANGATSDYGAYGAILAQQSAAGGAAAQLSYQTRQLELQAAAAERQDRIAAMNAQANTAGELAAGFGTIVGALNAPTVAAINAGAAENVATIHSAVAAAVGGFETQANMTYAAAQAAQGYAAGLASQTASILGAIQSSMSGMAAINKTSQPNQQFQDPNNLGNALDFAGKALGAYYTGGASLALS